MQQQQQLQTQPGARDDDGDDDVMTELVLKCVSSGSPMPSVEWLRNYVRSVTSSLPAASLPPSSSSLHTCQSAQWPAASGGPTGPMGHRARIHLAVGSPSTTWFI